MNPAKYTPSKAAPSLFRQWRAEQKKARHRKLWLVPLAFLSFELLWMLWQLGSASKADLESGYLMLLFNLQTINVLLFPILAAVLASRLCDMEIKGDTLKLLYTMQRRTAFYDCKYVTGLKYLSATVLGQGGLLLLFGRVYSFGAPLKPVMLLQYLAATFAVGSALLCLQQFLSLHSENQILPLAAGLAGSFLGLFSIFFPESVSRLIIWGYFVRFSTVVMDWDEGSRITTYYETPFPKLLFALFLLFATALYFAGRAVFTRKEV